MTQSLPNDLIMHCGTVRYLPFDEQLRAAALTGCRRLTISPRGYLALLEQGRTPRDLRAAAARHDVALDHLDPYVNWIAELPSPDPVRHVEEEDLFRVAEMMGARSVSLVGMFPQGAVTLTQMIDSFGDFCRKAATRGLHCDLEFVPIWGLPDLETAWAIVDAVDAPNGAIMIDMWHYHRGKPDDDLLRSIPGDRITAIQLNDATAALPPGRDMLDDSRDFRLQPGEGAFRIWEVMGILRETGGLNNVGPEIFTRDHQGLTAEAIAERCREGLQWAFATP